MPKLDLTTARRIKVAGGEALAIKGAGFAWVRPADIFPAAEIAAGGDYIHYRVEDAGGAQLSPAHGLPLVLDLFGTVSKTTIDGVEYLASASGCYWVSRDPWPSNTSLSLWFIDDGSRGGGWSFYNGPSSFSNTSSALQFARSSNSSVNAGNKYVRFNTPAAVPCESRQWDVLGGSGLSNIAAWHNNAAMSQSVLDDRGTSSAGTDFVLGGWKDSSGNVSPQGLKWRDVVLTIGWHPNESQRAVLETYRQARAVP